MRAGSTPGRVVLIDPLPDECELYEWALQLQGFDVAVITDPERAMGSALAGDVDVILTRFFVPGTMNAAGIARYVKAHDSSVGVIALTTHMEPQHLTDALAGGCDACLLLPAPLDEVLALVAAAVAARRHHPV
jgi:DNA-binding response OmpR family regulator